MRERVSHGQIYLMREPAMDRFTLGESQLWTDLPYEERAIQWTDLPYEREPAMDRSTL